MQRVTIKDIAEITKMSSGTVHRALTGKKGVSDEVRNRILEVAEELGYKPNYIASSLKRKALNVIVFLPNKTGINKYFYLPIWEGIYKAFSEHKDFNINYIELPFDEENQEKDIILKKFLDENKLEINGLITQASLGLENDKAIKHCIDNKIPTSLVVNDFEDLDRLCFVGGDYFTTGKLCAEMLSSQIDNGSDILVFCGNEKTPSHRLTVSGMESYILENNLEFRLVKIFDSEYKDEILNCAKNEILNNKNLKAIYSVNAKNTVLLCELLKSINCDKSFRVIGSDVFTESIEYMEQNVLDNIMHKNPRQQSYKATKMLIDYIIKNETPKQKVTLSKTEIVFKSNLNSHKPV